MMIRPLLVTPFLFFLAVLLPLAADADALPEREQRLHGHLQSLDRELRHALPRAARQAVAGAEPAADLRREAESFRRHLRALEAQTRRWAPRPPEELLARFRDLEQVVIDLERAAVLMERDPGTFLRRFESQGPAADGAALTPPAHGKGVPAADDCADAVAVGAGTFVGDTTEATNDGSANCGTSHFAPDMWFKLSAEEGGEVFIDTLGSAFDTVLSIHDGCPGIADNAVACSDNASGLQSLIAVDIEAGEEIFVRVGGYAGASGPFTLHVDAGGSVSGTVTAVATGEPIAGVPVTVFRQSPAGFAHATTGADGTYTVPGLRSGTYFAVIRNAAPYAPQIYDGVSCSGFGCNPLRDGAPIVFSPGAAVTGVDFGLDLGGTISGTVRDAGTGEPVEFATIDVLDDRGEFVDFAATDPAGHYSVEGLTADSYYLTAYSPEHQDELQTVVVGAGMVTEVDFDLRRLGAISGTVIEASGDPLPMVLVEAYYSPAAGPAYLAGYAMTDSSGHYTVGGLAVGSYVARTRSLEHLDAVYADLPCTAGCDLAAGTPITVEVESTTAGIDFALDRLGQITGSLTDTETGEPIAPNVLVWDADGGFLRFAEAVPGSFLAPRLVSGTYFLTTESSTHFDELYDDLPCLGGCDPTAGTPVAVALNQVAAGVDFDLVRLGEISGSVTVEATGDPLPGVSITVWDETGALVGEAATDDLGAYRVGGLAAGTYFARTAGTVSGDPFPFDDELYDDIPCAGAEPDACDVTAGTPIAVSAGAVVEGIDFALAPPPPEPVRIAGTVTDAETGQPIASVLVKAFDEMESLQGSAVTTAAGEYRIRGLAAGSYFVFTDGFEEGHDEPFPYRNELYDGILCEGACYPPATPVIVDADGVTEGIDFTLESGGTISGTITDADTGEPIVRFAEVTVWTIHGHQLRSYPADGSGTYAAVGLEPGTYYVRASARGYSAEVYDDQLCPPECNVTVGVPITVGLDAAVTGIDFALGRRGSIAGTVTDVATGNPIRGAVIEVWTENRRRLRTEISDAAGRYVAEGLGAGIYFLTAEERFYFDALYGGPRCPREGCGDPTSGTPVTIDFGMQTAGIDFPLNRGGVVSGRLTDAESGRELESVPAGAVLLWNEQGQQVTGLGGDLHGRYTFDTLPAGTYFVGAGDDFHYFTLHDGIPCSVQDPETCDPTLGTPLIVSEGHFTAADLALRPVCVPSDTTLCLNGGRFRVEAEWEDFDGGSGPGQAVGLTADSGYFWFFDGANVELVVKALDACVPPFDRFWVFAAGLTNLGARLTVTDTVTGEVRIYDNPPGTAFLPIRDTAAFATCAVGGGGGGSFGSGEAKLGKSCGGEGLCLRQERFRVDATWRTPEGVAGEGQSVQLSDDTGYLWFFDPDNVEVVIKVLDACGLEGFRNFWVFAAGLTDVEVVLRVTDTVSGEVREYVNPLGSAFQPVQDTSSFEVCP